MSLLGSSLSVTGMPFHFTIAFSVFASLIDIAFCVLRMYQLDVHGHIAAIAIVSNFAFRCLFVTSSYFSESDVRNDFASERAILAAEQDATDLLHDLYPPPRVNDIITGNKSTTVVYHNCGILYMDLVSFTKMSSSLSPTELMHVLNVIYSRFDELIEEAGLWKVETVSYAFSRTCVVDHK